MGRRIDIVGRKFGRMLVLRTWSERRGSHMHKMAECLCDCGNKKTVFANALTENRTRSCGCYNREEARKRTFKHGKRNSKLFGVWWSMHSRCERPNAYSYHNYGGRGIGVCSDWKEFLPFYEWSMSHGYKDGLTIDRIDNDGSYSPENCRWVTQKEQSRNTRFNVRVTFMGQTKCIAEWGEQFCIKGETIRRRLLRGWPVEDAITKPNGFCMPRKLLDKNRQKGGGWIERYKG